MGFKTDYKEITLKDFVNLNCIAKHVEVILTDYHAPILNGEPVLSEPGITVDEIPEIFADWYVEYFRTEFYEDASHLGNTVYIITISEP